MKTEKFQRKPFIVECVQVTAENMEAVAEWTGGTITETDPQICMQLNKPAVTWIQIEVSSPMNEKQSQAHIGDWVLYANRGFKIYTPKAFERTFEPVFKGERPEPKIHMDEKGLHRPAPKPTPPKLTVPPRVLEAIENAKMTDMEAHEIELETGTNPKAEVRHVHRSAETGEFVTEEVAEENPATTVEETIVVEPSGQAIVEDPYKGHNHSGQFPCPDDCPKFVALPNDADPS